MSPKVQSFKNIKHPFWRPDELKNEAYNLHLPGVCLWLSQCNGTEVDFIVPVRQPASINPSMRLTDSVIRSIHGLMFSYSNQLERQVSCDVCHPICTLPHSICPSVSISFSLPLFSIFSLFLFFSHL